MPEWDRTGYPRNCGCFTHDLESLPSPEYGWIARRVADVTALTQKVTGHGAVWNALFNAIRALDISSAAPV